MKPIYVVINEVERDEFEKEWQIPYGYGDCYISFNMDNALYHLEYNYSSSEDWIVEEISEKGRRKVIPGEL